MAANHDLVWVTRDEGPDGPLASALRRRGLRPVHEPAVTTIPLADAAETVRELGPGDWIVLTSARAVELLARPDPERSPRFAVVGPRTATAAAERGFPVDLVSISGDRRGIWSALAADEPTGSILFPRSRRADLPAGFDDRLIVVDLYDTVDRSVDPDAVRACGLATFTSPTAVESCRRQVPEFIDRAVTIGETTSRAVLRGGGTVLEQAASPTLENTADAVARVVGAA